MIQIRLPKREGYKIEILNPIYKEICSIVATLISVIIFAYFGIRSSIKDYFRQIEPT